MVKRNEKKLLGDDSAGSVEVKRDDDDGSLDAMSAVADLIARLQPQRVRHYCYRFLDADGLGKAASCGRIDDLPDDVPTGHDLGERFRRGGWYYVVSELVYMDEDGRRVREMKASPKVLVADDYERLPAPAVATPAASAPSSPGDSHSAFSDLLQSLDKFADIAVKLRGNVVTPPPVPPDVAALESALARERKDADRRVDRVREEFDEEIARLKRGGDAKESARPIIDAADVEGWGSALGKGAKAVKEVVDIFKKDVPGGEP